MKRMLLVVFLFSFLMTRGQEITVRSFKADDIDFRDFDSYFWAAHVDQQLDENLYLLGDLVLKADIREVIHEELGARGLRRNANDADLLVNFRIFSKPATLRGREGYGSSYWKKNEISSIEFGTNEIKIGAGTLIISLLDKNNGKLIWEGIASGLFQDNKITKDESVIRDAVRLILNQYSYRTSDYTKR